MDEDKYFLINRGQITKRLDPYYFKRTFIKQEEYLKSLGERVSIIRKNSKRIFSGVTPLSKGEAYTSIENGIPFIRSGDYSEENFIDFHNLVYLKPEIHYKQMKNSQIKKGDVLIAIVGATIGKVGVYEYEREANINQAICAIRLLNINPHYLQVFYLTPFGQKLLDRAKRPVARANINLEEIGSLPFILCSPEKQLNVVKIFEDAIKSKSEKERLANELLKSIDEYLLDQLGVILPQKPTNTIKNRIFKTAWINVIGDRFDPSYYTINWELKSTKYKTKRLPELVAIDPKTKTRHIKLLDEVSFIPMELVSETGEIKTSRTRLFSESKGYTVFQEDDLLWAKITPCMENGKSAIAKELVKSVGFGSTEYFVFRAMSPQTHMPFVYYLLHLEYIRNEAKKTFGGSAGHQRVSKAFFQKILLPFPDFKTQVKIAKELDYRKAKAYQLFAAAIQEFEETKQEIEKLIFE